MPLNTSTASCSESEPNARKLPKIGVLDFETDPFKHGRLPKVFAACFHDGTCCLTKWGSHRDTIRWAALRVRSFDGIVYAHNGGKFDFIAFLLGEGGETIWGEPVHCIAGRIVKMKYGQAEIRDSYAILPAPLRAYDKGEISYEKFEKSVRNKHKLEILDYLRRDCRSLRKLVMAFVSLHGIRPLTAASAGMRFAKKLELKVETLNDTKDAYVRQWYFGGLVLARKAGVHRGAFSLYDIKSAYPYAMLHEHPASSDNDFSTNTADIEPHSLLYVEGKNGVFLRRDEEGNKLGGEGKFRVSGWEYLAAKKLGLFKGKVIYVETPKATISFKPYVDHFFQQKEEAEKIGDKAGRLIAKIMLNALYGKFAQRNDRFRDYFIWPWEEDIEEIKKFGFGVEAEFEDWKFRVISKPSPHRGLYNVGTAASITGFVRAVVMKAIHETDAYYCDTDSIICDSRRKPSGVRNDLGGWGLETRGDILYIAGKKLYCLRILKELAPDAGTAKAKGYFWDGKKAWKIASKGCRLMPDQMLAICQGKEVLHENAAPSYSLLNSPFFVKRTIRATAPELAAKSKIT